MIVGLGNPGKKFEHTRHNAGFMAVDAFAVKNNFPEFAESKKHESLISENEDTLLIKPQTFMNDSGRAVQSLIKNHQVTLIVVHDDIDLPLGKIKFSQDSGAGGHKGVASIIQHLGHAHFIRLKIGIATDDKKAEEVVLQTFSQEEQEVLHSSIEKSAEALQYLITHGLEKTMNEYNR